MGSTPPGLTPPSLGAEGGGARNGSGKRGAPTGITSESSWLTWWMLQRPLWLPDRDEALRRAPVTDDAPLAQLGPAVAGATSGATARRDAAARQALPLLRALAQESAPLPDLRASALLALAKLSNDEETRTLLRATMLDPQAPDLTRESAALAMGLLRRSEPQRRMPLAVLADVRRDLLEMVDDVRAADRTRAFAAFALGLLGDQQFLPAAEQQGRLLVLGLWSRLARPEASGEQATALLTALGLQRSAQVPEQVLEGLRKLVVGRSVLGRRWSDVERSHALTALARLWPEGAHRDLLRVLSRAHEATPLLRAAAIAVGAHAGAWNEDARCAIYPVVAHALEGARDPWTRGLLRLAVGRLLAEDLAAGSVRVEAEGAARVLLGEVRRTPNDERGFAVLGLALAARAGRTRTPAPAWVAEAQDLLTDGLARVGEDDNVRAAYAVGLGLVGDTSAAAALQTAMDMPGLGPRARSAGAVALGQLGQQRPEVVRTLVVTLLDRRQADLRGEAALALSWLGTREALPLLLREIEDPSAPEHVLAEVSVALGRLGALGAITTLADVARDPKRSEPGRALAVVALGLVLDPEPRPSLLSIAVEANYPARTPALHELLTIL